VDGWIDGWTSELINEWLRSGLFSSISVRNWLNELITGLKMAYDKSKHVASSYR
jgi:hypothetical protein